MTQTEAYAHLHAPVSPTDRVVTVLLMLVVGSVAVFGALMGFVLTVDADDCDAVVPCFDGPTNLGFIASALMPCAFWLGALVVVIVRWANGRSTWWVPLAGGVLGLLVWALGLLAAYAGAPSY